MIDRLSDRGPGAELTAPTATPAAVPEAALPEAGLPEAGTRTPSAAAPGGPARPLPRTSGGWTRRQRAVLAAIVGVLFAAYTTYAWARHAKYETTGFDLGIFDQVVRAYAHFHAPTSPLKGVGYNILGDHFHPILVLLVPLYWIWDDPRVLLTAQAALFAVSVVPVARFAGRRFGPVAALFLAFAYGASWPIERAIHFDFHEIAFAAPLIALLVDALDRRAYRTVTACCALLLLVREDMGALVLLTGLLVAVRGPARGRDPSARRLGRRGGTLVLGAGLAGLGVLGYWLATSVIIPAFAPGGFTYWTFAALGPDPVSALRTMVLHPLKVLSLMVTPVVKFHTLVTIFYPTGFLALLSPYTLLSVPFLAERMLNDRPLLWETNFHYTSVIAPIVVMGAVDTAARLVRRFPRVLGMRRLGRARVGLVPVFVAWSVAVVGFQLAVKAPDYPVSGLWGGRVWSRDARWHAVHDVLPLIPPGQCIEADNQIAPQLTPRDYVTRVASRLVPGSNGLATWVVLDLSPTLKDTGWQGDPPVVALANALRRGYTITWHRSTIVLLHKDRPIAPVCRGLY